MHSDHFFPVLERSRDSDLLAQVASAMAVDDVPEDVLEVIRLGRVTALRKPDGGVREIVVGDILRRLVARTIARQVPKKAEAATAPFQYALSTKAGCECMAHMLHTLTDVDERAASCQSMELVRSTLSPGMHCCKDFSPWKTETRSSPL